MKKRIIEGLMSGDKRSQSEAYGLYKSRLLGYIINNGVDRWTAEDLIHDIFIRVFRNIHKLRSPEYFDSWLYKISYNIIIDFIRSRGSVNTAEVAGYEYLYSENWEVRLMDKDEVAILLKYLPGNLHRHQV